MSRIFILRRAAERELEDAYDYYERIREGLGGDLVALIQSVFDAILENPRLYAVAHRDIREALVSRFSYAFYYRTTKTHVIVISVFHTSRDPEIRRSRS